MAILFMTQGISLANSLPVITEFSISPAIIRYDESSTLTWRSVNATSATLNGVPVPVNGSKVVTPGTTTTYTIVVTGPGGTASDSVRVKVTGAYLTAVSDHEIDLGSLGSVKPGDTLTSTKTLLIGRSNMGTVTVSSFEGTDLTREETNAEGKGIGSYDRLPTTYDWRVSYDRKLSNNISMNLDITVETKGPGDEGSSDAGVYRGSFTITLSGSP